MTAGSAGVPPASWADDTGWHSRGYLPHFDRPGLIQMITFRLADALPAAYLTSLAVENTGQAGSTSRPVTPTCPRHRTTDAAWRRRLEALLDAGHGSCYLRD